MSNTVTSWVLQLIDRVTKPMREMTAATQNTSREVEALQDNLQDFEHAGVTAANEVSEALDDVGDGLQDVDEGTERVIKSSQKWTDVAMGFNQISELIDKVANSLDYATGIVELKDNIQRMTGQQGDQLDSTVAAVHRLGEVYKQNDEDIARSANALSKQLHISYAEALAFIETGFEKGANLNGDMLDQLKEYGPQIEQLGLSASEMLAIMTKAGQQGVMSDKAIDAIKEANLSIREMGQTQIDALTGIGLSAKDLAGKTTFEIVQMVSKAMEGASSQAKQLALTDIFKGAGEDAGMGWILGLNSIDLDINNIPSVQQSGASIRGWMADIQSWIATSLGGASEYIQTFAMGAIAINSVIGIMGTLNAALSGTAQATGIANAATMVWNATLWANPITWIVGILAALVAGVIYFSDKVDWCNGIVESVKASWKDWGGVIVDFILFPLKQVRGVLEGIWKLLNGDFSGAMDSFTAPVNDLVSSTSKAYNSTVTGYNKGIADFNDKQQQEAGGGAFGAMVASHPNKGQSSLPVIDGKIAPPKAGAKGGGAKGAGVANGLSGTGGGGNKALTMNLTINNHFSNVKSDLDIRTIADKVAGVIVDRVRDATVNFA